MSIPIQLKRGTRAQVDALATSGGILTGEPLFITDEQRTVTGVNASAYTGIVAFTAYHNAITAYTANTAVTNWTVDFNSGGGTYATGGYTVPVTGIYRLHISILMHSTGTNAGLLFKVNSTNRKRIAYASNPTAGYDMAVGEEFVNLVKGDVVYVIAMDATSWYGDAGAPIGRWNIQLIKN